MFLAPGRSEGGVVEGVEDSKRMRLGRDVCAWKSLVRVVNRSSKQSCTSFLTKSERQPVLPSRAPIGRCQQLLAR